MSKPISSYPTSQQATVIARRLRNYDPKGNGLGTASAKQAAELIMIRARASKLAAKQPKARE